jgi:alkylation response protein AidB-like acyl-CoA dehydrogenase
MYRLDLSQAALIERLNALADEHIAPFAGDVDREGRFPREAIEALAEEGFLGLTVPAEYGGIGQGMRAACAALEAVAQRDASAAMVYLMHLCGTAACRLAVRPEVTAPLLRQIAAGEHLTTLAWSEKGSRSHFWAPVSQAREAGEGRVFLDALKSWVTSAGQADSYVVSTRAAQGTEPTESTLYLLFKGDAGLSVDGAWDSLGMRGNASAPMALKDVEVRESERALSEPGQGFAQMMQVLPWFSLGNAAVSVGIAEAATQATIKHVTASRLEHLGSTLADLPNQRARVAKMRIATDRARAHLAAALDAVEGGSDATMLFVLEAKASAAETAMQVTDIAMNACGGAAFSRHLPVERLFRDSRAAAVMAPTTDVLHDFIGRAVCGMPLF